MDYASNDHGTVLRGVVAAVLAIIVVVAAASTTSERAQAQLGDSGFGVGIGTRQEGSGTRGGSERPRSNESKEGRSREKGRNIGIGIGIEIKEGMSPSQTETKGATAPKAARKGDTKQGNDRRAGGGGGQNKKDDETKTTYGISPPKILIPKDLPKAPPGITLLSKEEYSTLYTTVRKVIDKTKVIDKINQQVSDEVQKRDKIVANLAALGDKQPKKITVEVDIAVSAEDLLEKYNKDQDEKGQWKFTEKEYEDESGKKTKYNESTEAIDAFSKSDGYTYTTSKGPNQTIKVMLFVPKRPTEVKRDWGRIFVHELVHAKIDSMAILGISPKGKAGGIDSDNPLSWNDDDDEDVKGDDGKLTHEGWKTKLGEPKTGQPPPLGYQDHNKEFFDHIQDLMKELAAAK
jgi:hypothetical protein